MVVADFLNPLINLWNSFVLLVPGLIAAIVLAVVGYLIAFIIGHALKIVLIKAKLDKRVEKAHISKAIGYIKLSSLFGEIVKWYIFIIFLQSAVDIVDLGTLSGVLGTFVAWLPNLIAGLLILIFGLLFAEFVKLKMEEHAKNKLARSGANIMMMVIAVITVIIALDQIGIEVDLLENLVMLVLGALAVGIALAIGLSFGLGNKSEAHDIWKGIRKRL